MSELWVIDFGILENLEGIFQLGEESLLICSEKRKILLANS